MTTIRFPILNTDVAFAVSPRQVLLNRFLLFGMTAIVGILQGKFFQCRKMALDAIEPRRIGRRPVELDVVGFRIRQHPGFMIQGGGFTPDMQQKGVRGPIKNEAANGLKNLRGTIAMARTNIPDSATSQFFINHKDNVALDFRGPQADRIGYAVFGKVTKGMDVVDKIAAVSTGRRGPHGDVPVTPVVIQSVEVVQ
jgi:cyclophilin family peptidyl-prolyl cis-trans isomerase